MTESNNIVYIIKDDGSRNLTPAAKFGGIHVMSTVDYPIYGSSEVHIRRMKEALRGFTRDDFLLLVGDPISIGLAMHYALERSDRVQCLKWERMTNDYHVITIND